MTDLTAITTPFGLLDAETQKAMKAHGGPWQHYCDGRWRSASATWVDYPILDRAYRVKPAPPKPREFWIQRDWTSGGGFYVFDSAPLHPDGCIHVREVLPE